MKRFIPLLLVASCSTGTYMDDGDSAVERRDDAALGTGDGGSTATTPICDAELAAFRDDLWTPLLAVQCAGCHNAQGPAQATRMVFRAETQPGWLEANYRAAQAMARAELAGVPLLLLRPARARWTHSAVPLSLAD